MSTPQALRAIEANIADAQATAAEIARLITWHERERALHETALATLRKAKVNTDVVIDGLHDEARLCRQAMEAKT